MVYAEMAKETKMWLANKHNKTGSYRHGRVLWCVSWKREGSFKDDEAWRRSCEQVMPEIKKAEMDTIIN